MIAVLTNVAPGLSTVPPGPGTSAPGGAAGTPAKKDSFWQVLALGEAALREGVVSDPDLTAALDPQKTETADKSDSKSAVEPVDLDVVVGQPPLQALFANPNLSADTPTPATAMPATAMPALIVAVAGPTPTLPKPGPAQVAFAEINAPDVPQLSFSYAAVPPGQQFGAPRESEGTGAIPQNGSVGTNAETRLGSSAPRQPVAMEALKAEAVPLVPNQTRSQSPTISSNATAEGRVLDDPAKSTAQNSVPDHPIADAAVNPPEPEMLVPTQGAASGEPAHPPMAGWPAASPRQPGDDTQPGLAATVSSAENAWRQRWAAVDQPTITNDAATTGPTIVSAKGLTSIPAIPGVALLTANLELTTRPLDVAAVADPKKNSPAVVSKIVIAVPDAHAVEPTVAPQTPKTEAGSIEIIMPGSQSFDASVFAASPPPPSAASTPVGSPLNIAPSAIPPALTPAIAEMSKSGNNGPLELALSPEELGRLTISIRQEGDFVRVTLIVERPETLDLLRRHAGDFVADLRQSGFSGASLSFGQGWQGQTARFSDPEHHAEDTPTPQSHPTETKLSAPSRAPSGSGLDLRF